MKHSIGFLGEFKPIIRHFCLNKENERYFSGLSDRRKVRIAILDTGLDPLHGQFAPKLDKICFKNFENDCCNDSMSCVDHKHCKDEDGHGTFIAGIVDKVWDISELYVGKIASKRETARNYTQFVDSVAKVWSLPRSVSDIRTNDDVREYSGPVTGGKLTLSTSPWGFQLTKKPYVLSVMLSIMLRVRESSCSPLAITSAIAEALRGLPAKLALRSPSRPPT